MPETLTERVVAIGALLAAAVLIVLAAAARNAHQTAHVTAPAAAPAAAAESEPALAAGPVVDPVTAREPAAEARPAATQGAKLVVAAARGPCWVSIRAGSAEGRVLFEGILDGGRTLRFERTRIWIRLGASANVDVTVNGERVADLPGGTIELVATGSGVAPQSA